VLERTFTLNIALVICFPFSDPMLYAVNRYDGLLLEQQEIVYLSALWLAVDPLSEGLVSRSLATSNSTVAANDTAAGQVSGLIRPLTR